MRIAFCLFRYFPYGGLQRDFLRIAHEALRRGHMIDVYTMRWEGKYEVGLAIRTIATKGMQNHTRREDFVRQIKPYLEQGQYDLIVGFNKMPGLDVYYAADTCYQEKARKNHNWFYRLTSRYRHSVAYEKAVFSSESKTEILLIAKLQQDIFMQYYHTQPERFHLLPPGIARDRIAPFNAAEIRAAVRKEHNIADDEFMLLMVGSGFKTKGLDRTLQAFAQLPPALKNKAYVYVIGKDNALPFVELAKKLGINDRVIFLGGRDDVVSYLLAADLLLHPAYNENTGTVLLEALAAGLPVLTTSVCGYAPYIIVANAGKVISSFTQAEFNEALEKMMLSPERAKWKANGIAFAKVADIYSMPERAVDLIEGFQKS
ncbi:MAG: glycosyltransferase family 4 protein [Gammaproteobacteria bacterium]|nr:glycosyltransferase family 4 protein [Gammaproteobacteria bacterium]